MFCCKTFRMRYHLVAAICDRELLGKEIRKTPRFKVEESFYSERIIDEKEAVELMKECTIANIVGKKIVELAIGKKFITKENVIMIGDIPHAQFIK